MHIFSEKRCLAIMLVLLVICCAFLLLPLESARAQSASQAAAVEFVPLTDLPSDLRVQGNPSAFFNTLFRYGIIAAGFLAVIMIVIAGFIYMTTESISGKSDAKERITDALAGLVLVLASAIFLSAINPDILNFRLLEENPSVQISPERAENILQIVNDPKKTTEGRIDTPSGIKVGRYKLYGDETEEFKNAGTRFVIEDYKSKGPGVANEAKSEAEKACSSYGSNFVLEEQGGFGSIPTLTCKRK